MSNVRTGLAFAITIAMFYALCTIAWVLAPGPFLQFMNGLFHGMDFAPLVQAQGFELGGFLMALVVMSIWAFLAGTFFGWVSERLARG